MVKKGELESHIVGYDTVISGLLHRRETEVV